MMGRRLSRFSPPHAEGMQRAWACSQGPKCLAAEVVTSAHGLLKNEEGGMKNSPLAVAVGDMSYGPTQPS